MYGVFNMYSGITFFFRTKKYFLSKKILFVSFLNLFELPEYHCE